jgi:hypothetical protein
MRELSRPKNDQILSKAASALIAILQVVSSLVVVEIILEMFGECLRVAVEKTTYAAKRRTTGPI